MYGALTAAIGEREREREVSGTTNKCQLMLASPPPPGVWGGVTEESVVYKDSKMMLPIFRFSAN